jgi:hypothetical protein
MRLASHYKCEQIMEYREQQPRCPGEKILQKVNFLSLVARSERKPIPPVPSRLEEPGDQEKPGTRFRNAGLIMTPSLGSEQNRSRMVASWLWLSGP